MSILFTLALLAPLWSSAQDSDGDGLGDFQEVHKYRTDPAAADSDGDGTPDGDWHERREHTYFVRCVVQVMKPVTPRFLDGDFQDVRVLEEHEDRFELEVLLYPFSTAPQALEGDPDWRRRVAEDPELQRWLAPGLTADWDEELRTRLRAELAADGIDVDRLDDRALVEQVSSWLLGRAQAGDSFLPFVTRFDEAGEPFVPEELVPAVNGGVPPSADDFARQISARGMFEQRAHGSCSSAAIYLAGCLRALGIPTRTILAIPLFDAGDERQWELVRAGIQQPFVRHAILSGMRGMERSWASHTLNEVFVGGRWWMLDYDQLGVGILRPERFGLVIHVATFQDWADARMPETIGRRQTLHLRDANFRGANPYALLSVSERMGEHATLELPALELRAARVVSLSWTDEASLADDLRAWVARTGRFGLLARLEGLTSMASLRELLASAELGVLLEAPDHPTLSLALDPCTAWLRPDHAVVFLPVTPAVSRALVPGLEYRVRFTENSLAAHLQVPEELRVNRAAHAGR